MGALSKTVGKKLRIVSCKRGAYKKANFMGNGLWRYGAWMARWRAGLRQVVGRGATALREI